jgi:hypothetical protein
MPEQTDLIRKFQDLLHALAVPDDRPRVRSILLRRPRPDPPPIVCLIPDGEPATDPEQPLLRRTADWLRAPGQRRSIPRASVGIAALPPDMFDPEFAPPADNDSAELSGHCLPILDELVKGFTADDTRMGPIRFPRYRTADWLTRQRLTGAVTDHAAELRGRLPKLLRPPAGSDRVGPIAGLLPAWIGRLITAVLSVWPVLRVWLFLSGRIPGLSRVSYWFMHQRYLTPGLSDTFVGFAVRLTAGGRNQENLEQIAKLLVSAFLADLREAYRRRLWRPASWRRTAYPLALLDGVAATGAAGRLLRWINEIRNETGLFDPLVIVARTDRQFEARVAEIDPAIVAPRHVALLKRPFDDLDRSTDGYSRDPLQIWQSTIGDHRRHRDRNAWYLLLALPEELCGEVDAFGRAERAQPPAPPWPVRRPVLAAEALIVVAAIVISVIEVVRPELAAGCTVWPFHSGIDVAVHDNQCLGYSDNDRQVFSDDDELIQMQREVFRQNTIAEQLRHDNPRRPLVTLVYFVGLTYLDRNVRYPHAQVEELAGLAVRQRRANQQSGEAEPLLRVVVANGGSEMRDATWVVEHLLRGLLRSDPTVVGVIGLDRSTVETRRAIARLGELGVPTMSTTLSADGLDGVSPLYFQPVPDNKAQAKLVADYVAGARNPVDGTRLYDRVAIYYPTDPDDLYVRTLVEDVKLAVTDRGIPITSRSWDGQQGIYGLPMTCASPAGPGQRHPDELLFFAGRNQDFGPFVDAVAQQCSSDPPPILGDDSVTRVVAEKLVQRSAPVGLPVRYVAKTPVILGGSDCVQGRGVLGTESVGTEFRNLCAGLSGLLQDVHGFQDYWPGDRTGLAYDVAGLFLRAVQRNRARPERSGLDTAADRAAIGLELRLPDPDTGTVTGKLRFDGPGGVADGGTIGILFTPDLTNPGAKPQCLLMSPRSSDTQNSRAPSGCPVGTRATNEGWEAPAVPK